MHYTSSDHNVWNILWNRRMPVLEHTASQVFLDGIQRIGLQPDTIPDIADINARLDVITGWNVYQVTGLVPAKEFFISLGNRRFPSVLEIRPMNMLDYIEAPDVFHDVFGHVPLHSDVRFANYLSTFGRLAADVKTEYDITRLARLFWFTVEFGLIEENGQTKIYGSGLISSNADAANALSDKCERRPFDIMKVMDTDFRTDTIQPILYVLQSFDQLEYELGRL